MTTVETVMALSDAAFVRRRTLKRAANLSSVNEELVDHSVTGSPSGSSTEREPHYTHVQKSSDETENSDVLLENVSGNGNGSSNGNTERMALASRKRGEKLGASFMRKVKGFMRGAAGGVVAPPLGERRKSLDSPRGTAGRTDAVRMVGIAEEDKPNPRKEGRGHSHSFSADSSSATSARLNAKPPLLHSHTVPEEQSPKRYSVPVNFATEPMPSFSEAATTMVQQKGAGVSPALAPLALDVHDSTLLRGFADAGGKQSSEGEDVHPVEYTSHRTTSPVHDSFLLSPPPPVSRGPTEDNGDVEHDDYVSAQDGVADQLLAEAAVPPILQRGLLLMKVSEKRTFDISMSLSTLNNNSELNAFNIGGRRSKPVVVRVDPDQGHIIYESGVTWTGEGGRGCEDDTTPITMGPTTKGAHVIPIESIREIRSGADALASLVKSSSKNDAHDASSPLTASFPFISSRLPSQHQQQQPALIPVNSSPTLTTAGLSSTPPTLSHSVSLPPTISGSPLPSVLPTLPQTPPKTPSTLLPPSPASPSHTSTTNSIASRLITIIYTIPHKTQSQYKSLHLLFPDSRAPLSGQSSQEDPSHTPSTHPLSLPFIHQVSMPDSAASINMCQVFFHTLRKLRAVRLELMNGLGNMAVREAMWERILWKEGDVGVGGSSGEKGSSKDGKGNKGQGHGGRGDGKLEWGEVESLCRKLNVSLGKDELLALFKQADVSNSTYLTFSEFRKFLKLLKKRPEVKRLYKHIISITRDGKHLPECPFVQRNLTSSSQPHSPGLNDRSHYLHNHHHPRQRSVHHPYPTHAHHRKSSSHDYAVDLGDSTDGPFVVHPLQRSLSASGAHPRADNARKHDPSVLQRALSVSANHRPRSQVTFSHRPNDSEVGDVFDFCAFYHFMREMQKSTLGEDDLKTIFERYSGVGHHKLGDQVTAVPATPLNGWDNNEVTNGHESASAMSLAAFAAFLLSPANAALVDQLPGYILAAKLSSSHATTNTSTKSTTPNLQLASPIYQDMTRPLSEYYISSSHNTYLIGHQLVGTSTTEGYIRALLGGCRSVEVDIFDGDTEPMIFHGKTLTSKVSLRAVCRSIAKYGFVASPYPIIISAEMHLTTIEQQDMMAAIMIEEFGDSLIRMPPDGPPKLEHLPSPEDLKGKVLLKTRHLDLVSSKKTSGEGDHQDMDVSYSSLSASDTDVFSSDAGPAHPKKRRPSENDKSLGSELQRVGNTVLRRVGSRRKSAASSTAPQIRSNPSNASTALSVSPSKVNKPKPHKMSLALAALLVYTIGVKCRGINKKEQYAVEHMFSLSENTINKMLREVTYGYDDDHGESVGPHIREGVGKGGMMDLIKHCRTHLVRIYPKGMRVDSSNYEPHRYWSAGAQLVALNWQTCDTGLTLNHAMFQRNGRCGYVLKPLALRSAAHKHLLNKRTNHFMNVTIISAQQLPRAKDGKTIVDPYVELTLHVPDWTHQPFLPQMQANPNGSSQGASAFPGPMATSATFAQRLTCCTGVVKHNGFNPVWEEHLRLPFDCVGDMKDLIFVKFTVRQERKGGEEGEPLAVHCASLGSLQQGYRHLPLHDVQLRQYLFSTLFVRIDIQDVPP